VGHGRRPDHLHEAGKQLIDLTTNAPMRYNKHELVNNWFIVQYEHHDNET
jgi:hypothetical protein